MEDIEILKENVKEENNRLVISDMSVSDITE